MFQTLNFSRKASETKTANVEGAGPQGNEFFSKVLMLCVCQSQKNKFGQFRDLNNVSAEMDMPKWLGKDDKGEFIIQNEHVLKVLERVNKSGGSRDYYKRKTSIGAGKEKPNYSDLAYFAVERGVQLLRNVFHASREYSPLKFLRLFGYLFLDWSISPEVLVSSSTVKMVWDEDVEQPLTDLSPAPTMKMFSDPNAHQFNETAFDDFADKRKELVLRITHDVPVREEGSKMKSTRKVNGKAYTRPVNMMKIVLEYLHVYCVPKRTGTFYMVLSGHESSALVVFNIARAMRRLFLSRREPPITLPSEISPTSGVTEAEQQMIAMQDEFLKLLKPSDCHIPRNLNTVLSVISKADFDSMNKEKEEYKPAGSGKSGTPDVQSERQTQEEKEDTDGDVQREPKKPEGISLKLEKLAW